MPRSISSCTQPAVLKALPGAQLNPGVIIRASPGPGPLNVSTRDLWTGPLFDGTAH
ncbi:MAG: hypothetical protein RL369_1934 [Pseudomonadota bacterium]